MNVVRKYLNIKVASNSLDSFVLYNFAYNAYHIVRMGGGGGEVLVKELFRFDMQSKFDVGRLKIVIRKARQCIFSPFRLRSFAVLFAVRSAACDGEE